MQIKQKYKCTHIFSFSSKYFSSLRFSLSHFYNKQYLMFLASARNFAKRIKVREFYIPKSKAMIYTPKDKLEQDEDGKILVYKNSTSRPKWIYLPKLYFPILLMQAITSGNPLMGFGVIFVVAVGGPTVTALTQSTFGARVVNSVHLHGDGQKVDVAYKWAPFLSRTKTYSIADFRNLKSSYLMHLWSLHPIPMNILGFLENKMSDILPCYLCLDNFRFWIFWKNPSFVNEELFINIFNGVSIDTYSKLPVVYKFADRYKEITYKK